MRAAAGSGRTPRRVRDVVTSGVLLEDAENEFGGIQSRILRSTQYYTCRSVVKYACLDDNVRIPISNNARRRQRRCRNFLSALDRELNHSTRPITEVMEERTRRSAAHVKRESHVEF